jgi:acetyltransferase-like isoleucine patch superfamily enzyme/dTDP-4-dehydrorhamnose 3,5-epimerase-like enzyme
MSTNIHPHALVEAGANIGDDTRISAFARVLAGARIGRECHLWDQVFVDGSVALGDRVTLKCGAKLWGDIQVGNDVVIGPGATFTDDLYPKSRPHLAGHSGIVLEKGCTIGANATLLPGVRIGQGAMVGAGAVVTQSVPPNAIVAGNPAQISGYVTNQLDSGRRVARPHAQPLTGDSTKHQTFPSAVKGVSFHEFPVIQDLRGDLIVGEFTRHIPFPVRRYFLVFNVQSQEIRGEHAHRRCEQFLVCVSGSVRIAVDDGKNREDFILNRATQGLYVPPMTWATQYGYSSDGVLLVFASDFYDPADYIRDYQDFLSVAATR